MDIYDLAKYYRDNRDINIFYVLPMYIEEKYGLTKWKIKIILMSFESFEQFMKDSNLKKYKPMTLMSEHDSTFTNSKFQEILKENEIFKKLNIKDDHHALGLIVHCAV